jgi:hypothetical protein
MLPGSADGFADHPACTHMHRIGVLTVGRIALFAHQEYWK